MLIEELVSSIRIRLGEVALDRSNGELLIVRGDCNQRTIQI